MLNRPGILVLTACSMLFLGACEGRPKTAMGGLIGGGALGAGAFLASKSIKGGKYTLPITVVSAGLGALIGSGIGDALDKTDQMHHLATTQFALETLPTNQPKEWNNAETANSGVVIPKETFKKPSGQWCRKYDYHIMHDTKVSSGKGLACRDNNGKWESVGTPSLSIL